MINGPAFLSSLFAGAIVLAVTVNAFGQGTRSDYERADSLGQRTLHKVRNDSVMPQWSANGDSFWYLSEDAGGQKQPWIVDALHGTRRAATDAERAAMGNPSLPDLGKQIASKNGGGEATVILRNETGRPATLFWIDTNGERKPYGTIDAGQKTERSTFAGHVWLVTDPDDKTLGVFRAQDGTGEAVIRSQRENIANAAGDDEEDDSTAKNVSPDGKWKAYEQDGNFYLKNIRTGEKQRLGSAADNTTRYDGQPKWSPDSKHLVMNQTIETQKHIVNLVQSSPPDQVEPKLLSFTYYKPGDALPLTKPHLFNIAAGGAEVKIDDALFGEPVYGDNNRLRWDSDSRRFTFYYNARGHQSARVIAVDAATGKATAIVDERAETFIDYYTKMYLEFVSDNELVWMSERDGWNHLYLYDAKTGRVKNQITKGEWVVRGVDRIDAQKRQIWFRAGGVDPKQDPYYIHECRINFDGTGFVDLTPGDGTHTTKYSPDKRFYIDTYSRVDMPPVSELRRTSDGKLLCPLEQADASALLATGWRYPERFVTKGRDGTTDIYGVIYRPTMFDPSKKYPVVEDIYAGPPGSAVPKAFGRYTGQIETAELGFIVVQIDGMGTDFRCKAFQNVAWHNIADAGFPDRKLWIRAAAAQHPEMDLSKGVGIYGVSAGGQNALGALEFHNDLYTVAVAACGCHDNRMDKASWNEQYMGYPVGPWYAQNSNVVNAPKMQGKLLLIVGELDHNVDPASTMQVCNALIKADKDFDLLVVPNADHGWGGKYGERRRKDFLVRNLLGVEPRHEADAPPSTTQAAAN